MKKHKIASSSLYKGGGFVAFVLIAAFVAWFAYVRAQDFFKGYDITQIKGIAIENTPTVQLNELGTPILPTQNSVESIGPAPRPWDGASRVNVLVMGLDYGDWSEERGGASRTDTMILFTVDPLTLSAGMLNIPRDLWVNIPGFDYGKINTAHYIGDAFQLPEGGPGLAIRTVEQFLGVPINYYALVDFYAFEKLINTIGGIEVDVPVEIKVDPIGKHNTVILQPGKQVLDGPVALAYARARNTEGADFDRAQRQQQVIMAIRDKVLTPSMFPMLVSKAEAIYSDIASGIHTNMTLDEAIQLAWLVQQIPTENIHRGAIAPPDQVLFAKSPDGTMDILKPIPDKIRLLRDEIFLGAGISPLPTKAGAEELMRAEAARIEVLNGTMVEGLAGRTQEYLISQGASSVTVGNAGELPTNTKVIDFTGNPYTIRYLVELMKITPYNIYYTNDPSSQVDVKIVLGADWANNNPLP